MWVGEEGLAVIVIVMTWWGRWRYHINANVTVEVITMGWYEKCRVRWWQLDYGDTRQIGMVVRTLAADESIVWSAKGTMMRMDSHSNNTKRISQVAGSWGSCACNTLITGSKSPTSWGKNFTASSQCWVNGLPYIDDENVLPIVL